MLISSHLSFIYIPVPRLKISHSLFGVRMEGERKFPGDDRVVLAHLVSCRADSFT